MIGPPPYTVRLRYRPKALPEGIRANIDTPIASSAENGLVIEVAGWIAHFDDAAEAPPVSVVVSVGTFGWLETPIGLNRPDVVRAQRDDSGRQPISDKCGFSLLLPVHMIRNAGPYSVCVKRADGRQYEFAEIQFEAPISGSWRLKTSVRPLIINSIGRVGSSLLCRMLSEHVALHVPKSHNQYGEIAVCDYATRLLAVMASNGSYGALNKVEMVPDFHHVEPPHFASRMLRSPTVEEFHHGHVVRSLTEGARDLSSRVLLDYISYVRAFQPSVRYVVEKSWNSYNVNLLRLLFDDVKEIFVVREPNEFIQSQNAFLQKEGASTGYIDEQFAVAPNRLGNLARSWNDRKSAAFLVKYEELVADPEDVLARLCDYLELPRATEFLRKASAMVGDDSTHSQMLRTTREEVRPLFREYIKSLPDIQQMAAEDYLREFGY